ncbi:Wadjet anti-phage system protein JetD domain-containing protein [Achromobacter marplatensis]|uniref:Wadjet anti-phage system protein JetD domain-containing protein n=1 Tax=Achromobacter marplatensis TaxID=470868 RepID=UPI0028EE4931|nr:Wadjet anti-phage system protein JetD domain-containing protein [Achromobacter marplatensis]
MSEFSIGRDLLAKLLEAGNKHAAGARKRSPALTAADLKPYRDLRDREKKQECDETFLAARDAGGITFERDKLNPTEGLFLRIDLVDATALAAFLGRRTYADLLADTVAQLEPLEAEFPVISDVIMRWGSMAKVRGLGPLDATTWLDAVKVIRACRTRSQEAIAAPVREFSARLLFDSKRIESLTPQLDVLLSGTVEALPRAAAQVWQELGLFREEQPVLLAGHVHIARERSTGLIDAPYVGLPAATILGVTSDVQELITIENKTTFHSEAKRRHNDTALLIFTAGMPSPAWRAMYRRLLTSLPPTTLINHWGDVDEGGFRIAATIAAVAREAGFILQPHGMSPGNVPLEVRVKASARTLDRIEHFACAAGWPELGLAVRDAGFVVEQEALIRE